jgi:aldose 1-epimerase
MRFNATTSKPTIVNMTQHSYFNLAGTGDVLNHQLMIKAEQMTPIDANLIPTGELRPVAGGPFDFRIAKRIGLDIESDDEQLSLGQGYDHNFVLKNEASEVLKLAATVSDPESGRVLDLLTTEPAMQFYTANHLGGSLTGKGRSYGPRSGFCLEPQHTPDSPNQPAFPSATLLPGEQYRSRSVYRFSTTN